MKLFKFYSTAELFKHSDCIMNIEGQHFNAIVTEYHEKEKAYVVRFDTDKADMREFHQDMSFAKERIETMLIAVGVDEKEALELSQKMKFVIK